MTDLEKADSDAKSFWKTIACASGTAQDRENQYRFVAWCLAWAVLFTFGNQILKAHSDLAWPLAWTIAVIPSLVGVGAVLAYLRFLRMADELIQKMQMEGLAFGFGAGILFALGYDIFEEAGAPHLEIDDLLLVLMGGWMIGQMLANHLFNMTDCAKIEVARYF
jgi:hypothetical protein